jgi:hypothetical protein
MPISDDQIALYLNLATSKTRAAKGDIGWLTGTPGTIVPVSASSSLETQCMVVGSCIWIANNEDVDSDFQCDFLNRIGISRYSVLVRHVEAHQTRLLPTHAGKFNVSSGAKPGEKLMARLTDTRNNTEAVFPEFRLPEANAQGSCTSYSLTSALAPVAEGIVFIKGSYQGTDGENEHAEQKLMAALGKYLQGYGTGIYSKSVTVSGCKSACSTCRGVLEAITLRLRNGLSANRLFFDDAALVGARTEVGMGASHPKGIKKLDIAHYFP